MPRPESRMEINGMQLNCQSINNKLGDLKLLIGHLKPDFVAFSETWITCNSPSFYNYHAEWKHRHDRPGGGLGFLIRRGLQYENFELSPFINGCLEVQAMKIHLRSRQTIVILGIYNPNRNLSYAEMEFYIDQLGDKFVILGDFNAHSPILSDNCARTNTTGRTVEEMISSSRAALITPYNFFTRIDLANLSTSCLDLCFASANIATVCSVELLRGVGSDHLPVKIKIELEPKFSEIRTRKHWKTTSRDLIEFSKGIKRTGIYLPNDTETFVGNFTDRIVSSANENLKSTTGKFQEGKRTPWWDAECFRAIYERRRARKNLERHPTISNADAYKEKDRKVKEISKKKRNESFQNFISSVEHDTPPKEMWKKIKCFEKRQYHLSIPPLFINDELVIDGKEKADYFARSFTQNPMITVRTTSRMKQTIIAAMEAGIGERHNQDFTIAELSYALKAIKKESSPGEDGITYSMIKSFSSETVQELLCIYNQILALGKYPAQWKDGLIVPIPKLGKPSYEITSYRPITMLPCLGKVFERLLKNRIEYIVEDMKILANSQSGFRCGQGTLDVLLKLENLIRNSMSRNKVCLVTYIDLKSAFDQMWGIGMIYKLAHYGLKGRLLKLLFSYFTDRGIKVWIDGETSDRHQIKSGTPQGGVLSPLLFNIMLSDIPTSNEIQLLIYADDITIVCEGDDGEEAGRIMETYLEQFIEWTDTWGLAVNLNKTTIQYFTRKRIQCPCVRFNDMALNYKKEQNILGMVFDSPYLNWGEHIKTLRANCLRRIDLMKVIASTKWGMPARALRRFYISYVRAKIAYGSILYASASKTNLSKLEVIQNAAMRLILGARKTSPILSLQVESFITPLELHRRYLSIKQYIKLKHRPEGFSTTSDLGININETIPANKTFLSRTENYLVELELPQLRYKPNPMNSPLPPWDDVSQHVICYSNIQDNQSFKFYLQTMWEGYSTIYCDGSKVSVSVETSVGSAVYYASKSTVSCWKLNSDHTVLAAELFAIYKAMAGINGSGLRVIIFSDSRS